MSTTEIRRADGLLQFSRWFDAPRELVFEALSRPDHLVRWWGPPDCPVLECTVDFTVGGRWHYRLGTPGPDAVWSTATYTQIDRPALIAYVEETSNDAGAVLPGRTTDVTIRLTEVDGGTRLEATLRYRDQAGLTAAVARGVERGFPAALDELADLLCEPANREGERSKSHPQTARRSATRPSAPVPS